MGVGLGVGWEREERAPRTPSCRSHRCQRVPSRPLLPSSTLGVGHLRSDNRVYETDAATEHESGETIAKERCIWGVAHRHHIQQLILVEMPTSVHIHGLEQFLRFKFECVQARRCRAQEGFGVGVDSHWRYRAQLGPGGKPAFVRRRSRRECDGSGSRGRTARPWR